MKHDEISDALNYLDDDIIEETDTVRQNPKGQKKVIFTKSWRNLSLASCLAIICIAGVSFGALKLGNIGNKSATSDGIALENATETAEGSMADESVSPDTEGSKKEDIAGNSSAGAAQNSTSSESLAHALTEEELFHQENTIIFKGIVTALGEAFLSTGTSNQTEKVEIASIRVLESYRGSCEDGDVLEVLLPQRSAEMVWLEDTETISAIDIGTTGIFMVLPYEDENVADYYFPDGQRYAFVETEDGLVFDRVAYSSIAGAATLEEIESYVVKMLNK